MYCLKCGKDTQQDQVFCDSCLQTMEAYPVKPGTVVNLPKQDPMAAAKKSSHRKRLMTPDEQVIYLRKHLRRSRAFALILAALLVLSSGMLLYEILNPDAPVIGKNYTIDTTRETD